jgi:hypothetical protein
MLGIGLGTLGDTKSDDEIYKWFDEEQTPSLRKRVGTVVHGVRDLLSSSYND